MTDQPERPSADDRLRALLSVDLDALRRDPAPPADVDAASEPETPDHADAGSEWSSDGEERFSEAVLEQPAEVGPRSPAPAPTATAPEPVGATETAPPIAPPPEPPGGRTPPAAAPSPSVFEDLGAAEVPAGEDRDEPESASEPSTRRAPRLRRGMAVVSLLVLFVGGGVLVWLGVDLLRSSTAGTVVAPVTDPGALGFEAAVEPTPSIAVFTEGADGALDAITVLTLPTNTSGAVALVPRRTVADLPLFGVTTLDAPYDLADPEAGARGLASALGTGLREAVSIDDARWAQLVGPVAPLEFDNPNALSIDGEERFPVGPIRLEAADVGPYLRATNEGENDPARLYRHEVFWAAWLDAVAADGRVEAVPGEIDTGIAHYVRAIAGRDRAIHALPVVAAASGEFGDAPAWEPVEDRWDALLAELFPFPTSTEPGDRARARVLAGSFALGTDQGLEAATGAAVRIPPAGIEVVLVGTADRSDVATTVVRYSAPEFRSQAEAVVELLGVGSAELDERPTDDIDLTVTLGADYG